ncbi:MAG: 30S ribosome-binding factor RbfA [Clostridiales bacterium]|nr:30S ribosome-binding factor RbfA [Clostridiales bacterium]
MRKDSKKNLRLNSDIQFHLSHIISGDIKDPRIHPMASVSGVECAPDLKTCKVYISVLGTDKDRQDTMDGLKSASGYIRKCLASSLNLRNTPELIFISDTSIEYGVEMIKKIDALGIKHDEDEDAEPEE